MAALMGIQARAMPPAWNVSEASLLQQDFGAIEIRDAGLDVKHKIENAHLRTSNTIYVGAQL